MAVEFVTLSNFLKFLSFTFLIHTVGISTAPAARCLCELKREWDAGCAHWGACPVVCRD